MPETGSMWCTEISSRGQEEKNHRDRSGQRCVRGTSTDRRSQYDNEEYKGWRWFCVHTAAVALKCSGKMGGEGTQAEESWFIHRRWINRMLSSFGVVWLGDECIWRNWISVNYEPVEVSMQISIFDQTLNSCADKLGQMGRVPCRQPKYPWDMDTMEWDGEARALWEM